MRRSVQTREVDVPATSEAQVNPEQQQVADAGAGGTEGAGDESPRKLTPEQAEQLRKEARESFDSLDTDGDGYIMATEVEDLFRQLNYEDSFVQFSEDQLKELGAEFLKLGDANGDGKVSFDEYFSAALRDSGVEV